MKITKIEKKKRRYLVELDSEERLYVTEDTIVRFMLSKGTELDDETLSDIKDFAQFSYGKNLALYYLSFKTRTTKEVRDYLLKYEIDENRIPAIIDHLTSERWLDDKRYTTQVFEQNAYSGDKGILAISQKLRQRGIAQSTIDEVAASVDFSTVALRVAEKLCRKYEGKLSRKGFEMKLVQAMASKGFSYAESKEAIAQLEIEEDEDNELELLYREAEKSHAKYSRRYEGYELKQRLVQALARKGFQFDDIHQVLRDII